jgi:Leucine-rich repeat (LRR) protein
LAPRMQGARYRALHDGYWIDPDELDSLSMSALKVREDIARIYTHSAGMAHLFMDRRLPRIDNETASSDEASPAVNEDPAIASLKRLDSFDSEASRAAFFASLIAAYRGDNPPKELWQLAGDENAQQDYLHFQLVRDRHIDSLKHMPLDALAIKELVLTRSRLNAPSWRTVGRFKQLTWLDVSNTNAKSDDLRWLKELTGLERLSLEGVAIDRELIEDVSKLPTLRELDLSSCKLEDDMLLPLKQCTQLETLWLSGNTRLTSASLAGLEKLPKLKSVALDHTSITTAEDKAFNERLKASPPAAKR